MKLIYRQQYMDRLKKLIGTPDIKIITGMRRSGKSEILKALKKEMMERNDKANIIMIDYADLKFDPLKTYKKLYQYVEEQYHAGVDNILLIDEVQLCDQFELAINSFHNSQKYDIYITGSNAFLLSSDLATMFTGRFIEIPIFPFSFKEYCQYFEIEGSMLDLQQYLVDGGMAGSYVYTENRDRMQYIEDIYRTSVKRDLVDKYGITEHALLDTLTDYLMDNVSNLTTANNISNTLKQNKMKTNHITINNYLQYLCSAFLFYKVKRYDVRGKKYLETNDKYYLVDTSFRFALLGTRNMDYGRMYENIVAIELLRRGYAIYVGKLYEKEIDFIAFKNNKKLYIQVADHISNEETRERELLPLVSVKDAYPKMIFANTGHAPYDIEGIKIMDLAYWLKHDQ